MGSQLYSYYERELVYLRQFAQEFARQYPAAAGRLLLGPNRSDDPHVERMIEATALLAGRVQAKIDDEFPELTDALLSVLYPHYLAPIPTMGILQFELDGNRANLPQGFTIPRHSRVQTQRVGELVCRFRTGYPVVLWPVRVVQARLAPPPFPAGVQAPPQAVALLRLQLECQGDLTFARLALERLRFHLSGEPALVAALYELILNQAVQLVLQSPETQKTPIVLDPEEAIGSVGFEADEGLLPYSRQSFAGYRLLTEFFVFPRKYLFLEVSGFRAAAQSGYQRRLELLLFLKRGNPSLEQAVSPEMFRLGCTPIVNLFEQTAEPIALTHTTHEYRVVPDATLARSMEVYSIDAVARTDMTTDRSLDCRPFFSVEHQQGSEEPPVFWYAVRRAAASAEGPQTEVYLSLVDLGFDPLATSREILTVRTTCTNGAVPYRLAQSGGRIEFELAGSAPLAEIRLLGSLSPALRPPLRRGAYWRLVSHLALNHLSLTEATSGRQALQEILRLYDAGAAAGGPAGAANRQLIEGIASVAARPVVVRTPLGLASGFARGILVTVELDEEMYVGTGAYLFGGVLERFLGLYCSVNSFCQLVVRSRQSGEILKRWPPRAGQHILL